MTDFEPQQPNDKNSPRTTCWLVVLVLLSIESAAFAQEQFQVAMRDGTQLATQVWRPEGDGPWPAVLSRAYNTSFNGDVRRFKAAGYVCVGQQTRGGGGQDGTRFLYDRTDGYDAVEWIASQAWSNGQVAMYGKSAWGITQWLAALEQPPHLKAIIPQNYSMDGWRCGYRAQGAVTLAMTANGRALAGGSTPDRRWYLENDLPLKDLDLKGVGQENKLWNDYLAHNRWGPYWSQWSLRSDNRDQSFNRIQVPVFIMGGWWDYYAGQALNDWLRLSEVSPQLEVRVAISATDHVDRSPAGRRFPGGEKDEAGLAIQWLDHVLRGKPTAIASEAPIRVFTMGSNRWQLFREWPPPQSRLTDFYLHNADGGRRGTLSLSVPQDSSFSDFEYDPADPVPTLGGGHSIHFQHPTVPVGSFDHRANESRDDVLAFSTERLEKAVELTGPVVLDFWAASDARDTDWTAILLDIDRSGTAYNVTQGIVRARFRSNLYGPPQLLEPNQVYRYRLELLPTSHSFAAGHRIGLHFSSSNYPLWDRNPNTGGAIDEETRTRIARQRLFHSPQRPSRLILSVVAPE